MRIVPISCIRDGMILAEDLYSDNNDLMLRRGTTLGEHYIKSIRRIGYHRIHVKDDLSKDIEDEEIVSQRVRGRTLKNIEEIFILSRMGNENIKENLKVARSQVENIVDEIYTNKDLLVNLIDLKTYDDYTYNHSVNVSIISITIGVALGMDKEELCDLGFAALLHDIGKVYIDRDIINKPGKLTDEEFEEMKKHSDFGYRHIINGYGVSDKVLKGILEHHEKYGGGGYPNNLKGKDISYFGRIISVADVYDALTSNRPYRKAFLPSDAMEYIMASNVSHFDPDVVGIFSTKLAPYAVGTFISLSNNLKAVVVENNKETLQRPKVRVIEESGEKVEPYIIDLSDYQYLNVTIIEIL